MSEYNDAFNQVAEAYHTVRPRYPAETIDTLLEKGDFRPCDHVVEFGAGSGILTSQLVERGLIVTAVEPGDNLRRIAEGTLSEPITAGRVRLVANTALGAFAAGQLPEAYDGAVMGTARRWVDDDAGHFRAALHELLRPETLDRPAACVAALHNTTAVRDNGGGEIFDATQDVYLRHMGTTGELIPYAAALAAESFGAGFTPVHFGYDLQPVRLSAEGYMALINTFGPIVKLDPAAREALSAELKQRIDFHFAGAVTVVHAVTLDIARRVL